MKKQPFAVVNGRLLQCLGEDGRRTHGLQSLAQQLRIVRLHDDLTNRFGLSHGVHRCQPIHSRIVFLFTTIFYQGAQLPVEREKQIARIFQRDIVAVPDDLEEGN